MEIIKTDLLVIGTGGAGLRAALAARREGAEVLLASKTPDGKSTCTYLSAGAFTLAAEGLTREDHLKRTLESGKGVNDLRLAQILVDEAPECVRELEAFGLSGEWSKGRFTCLGKAPAWGAPLTNILAGKARQAGVSFLPWVMISELLLEDGQAAGALAFNFREGKPVGIVAKAILLANGGAGALYKRRDNPVRTTGDGYALAYQAGCTLRDMEFVQFLPTGLCEPGRPALLLSVWFPHAGKTINSAGEDILEKYHITEKPAAALARDSFSLAIFLEEEAGRPVSLDLRSVAEGGWPKDPVGREQRKMLTEDLHCTERVVRISPMCHHCMGGVATDEEGRTGVPGIFAAGEVVGGVHGANRLGGNALAEILVFGRRAGKAAGLWTRDKGRSRKIETLIQKRLEDLPGMQGGAKGKVLPRELRKELEEIFWKDLGILRSGKGLSGALDSLGKLKAEGLGRLKVEGPKGILEKMEIENAIQVGEMVARSALMREESRGAQFRRDFPKTDDEKWKGNIFLRQSSEGMHLEFRPLPGKKP